MTAPTSEATGGWKQLSPERAQLLCDAYVRAHPARLRRFAGQMQYAGADLESFDLRTLDGLDQLWAWCMEHLDRDRTTVVGDLSPEALGWYPILQGLSVDDSWPRWRTEARSAAASDFVSGFAAWAAQFAINEWGATWVAGTRSNLNEGLVGRPLLAIPTLPHKVRTIRVNGEELVGDTLYVVAEHAVGQPLTTARLGLPVTAPWHVWARDLGHNFVDWSVLPAADAMGFHEAYVRAHPIRLRRFSELLQRHGMRASKATVQSAADLDRIWSWSVKHQLTTRLGDPPHPHPAGWYPELDDFEVPDGWPAWSDHRVGGQALEFGSGFAAAIAQVALTEWGASWELAEDSDEPGEVHRTLLRLPQENERQVRRVNVELALVDWMANSLAGSGQRVKRPKRGGDLLTTIVGRLAETRLWHGWAPLPDREPIPVARRTAGVVDPEIQVYANEDPHGRLDRHAYHVYFDRRFAGDMPDHGDRLAAALKKTRGIASVERIDRDGLYVETTRLGPKDVDTFDSLVLGRWQKIRRREG